MTGFRHNPIAPWGADKVDHNRNELVEACKGLIHQIKDVTPGTEVEHWLNQVHGPGSTLYETLARLVRLGVEHGWAAETEIDGPNYRRNRVCAPAEDNCYFSITTVYMDSTGNQQNNPENALRGQYPLSPLW